MAAVAVPTPVLVAQWVLLGALTLLVVIMYRQLAYLMRLGRGASEDGGIELGRPAPAFTYHVRRGTRRTFDPIGKPAIVLFAEPACPACERAVEELTAIYSGSVPNDVRALIVTQARDGLLDTSDAFGRTHVELGQVDRDVAERLYETHLTPFFFGIDAHGRIVAKLSTDKRRDIEKIISAVETVGNGERVAPATR
jgi:hypothetical protein